MELAAEVGFLGGGFFLTFHTFCPPLAVSSIVHEEEKKPDHSGVPAVG